MTHVRHEFVEFIPTMLEQGVIYVSVPYATVVHLCCCGCGEEVVTPLTPTDWTLVFDGDAISLEPSIGNWVLPCRSHYWVIRNRILWAKAWTDAQIAEGRKEDLRRKAAYFRHSGAKDVDPGFLSRVSSEDVRLGGGHDCYDTSANGSTRRVVSYTRVYRRPAGARRKLVSTSDESHAASTAQSAPQRLVEEASLILCDTPAPCAMGGDDQSSGDHRRHELHDRRWRTEGGHPARHRAHLKERRGGKFRQVGTAGTQTHFIAALRRILGIISARLC